MNELVKYSVDNSVEIIELFCSGEINLEDLIEEDKIILEQLNNVFEKKEKYIRYEVDVEKKEKVRILSSFYNNYKELIELLKSNPKNIEIKLPENKSYVSLITKLYKKIIGNQYKNYEIKQNDYELIISEKEQLLKK